MKRLTSERVNGIKTGYWSTAKKDELVQRLAEYENTGLEPDEIWKIDHLYQELSREVMELRKRLKWIPIEEQLPETEEYILLSFSNFSLPAIGRYETDSNGNGAFFLGDCDEEDTCISQDLFVNAWRPLPEPYKANEEERMEENQ